MPQDYYIYRTWDGDRKMTVVNGQPYYQSTGQSSYSPGKWLPFIMLHGTKPIYASQLPFNYDKPFLTDHIYNHPVGHIVKLFFKEELSDLKKGTIAVNKSDHRIPAKYLLITSARLGGGKQYSDQELKIAGLSEAEIALAKTPIEFEDKPTHIFDENQTEEMNAWLIDHGALLIKKLQTNPNGVVVLPDQDVKLCQPLKLAIQALKEDKNPPKIKTSEITLYNQKLSSLQELLKPLLDEKNEIKKGVSSDDVTQVLEQLHKLENEFKAEDHTYFSQFFIAEKSKYFEVMIKIHQHIISQIKSSYNISEPKTKETQVVISRRGYIQTS